MFLASARGVHAESHRGRSLLVPPWQAAALLLLIALVPSLFKLVYYPHNLGSDDAFIHLQVARNVASGHGWGINPDQPVNMSTSPLFTVFVATVEKLTRAHAIGIIQLCTCLMGACGIFLLYCRIAFRASIQWPAYVTAAIAAFSLNLWRWNGDVMEAIAGFAAVSLILYLFRDWQSISLVASLRNGILLGLAVLLRPELFLAASLVTVLMAILGRPGKRIASALLIAAGTTLVVAPWLWFCSRYFSSVLPTTFYAKSAAAPILGNAYLVRQIVGLAAESYAWPCLLLLILIALAIRSRIGAPILVELLLPAGLLAAILAFYYLRTRGVESIGRYLLPFEPCLVCVIGILLNAVTNARNSPQRFRLAAVFLALHIGTAAIINQFFLAPNLAAFNNQYRATMEAAAEYLAAHTTPPDRVLIAWDIGVVSWTANGRFQIMDVGGLATPSLAHLGLPQQLALAQPKYFVFSLASVEDALSSRFPALLEPVWHRRFKQHGLWVSLTIPYNFTTIYKVKTLPVR